MKLLADFGRFPNFLPFLVASEYFLDLDSAVIDVSVQDLLLSVSHRFMCVFHRLSQIVQLHVEAELLGQRKEPFQVFDITIFSH